MADVPHPPLVASRDVLAQNSQNLSTMAMPDVSSKFIYNFRETAFEFHAIVVKSLSENRQFDTIKLFGESRELIYLRPKAFSIPDRDHRLLLRGPKVPIYGGDDVTFVIGDPYREWIAIFSDDRCPNFGIQSVVVQDPQFPEAAVEIIYERIQKPAQAHFKIIFKDDRNEDRKIYITSGEIWATSHGDDQRTKRLLRCFGDDLTKHMERSSSEIPKSKKMRPEPYKLELVSGEGIGLYKSHLILPASEEHKISDLSIHLDLELELDRGGGTTPYSCSLVRTASFKAPDNPKWLQEKDFIPHAMEVTKETCHLKIEDFSEIQVEVSWFNDISGYDRGGKIVLEGYGDGDCDYKDYEWADRQETDWNNPEEVEKRSKLINGDW